MARWLNKKIFLSAVFIFAALFSFAQNEDNTPEYKEYKTSDQFYKFHKRSKVIGAWQVNQLKEGAIVVRLRTNKNLIDALVAQGNTELASEKRAENFVINKNTIMAYTRNFSFCKLYFIFSSSSDTLLKGARSGIFVDSNLVVDPSIEMKESFYLLVERDYAYNSSIGFVREDSARKTKETGNPVREMGAVVKNKYGHQLKAPFPYYVKDKTFADYLVPGIAMPMRGGGIYIWVAFDDLNGQEKLKKEYPDASTMIKVKIKKQYTYKCIAQTVQQLNENLSEYYQSSPMPEVKKLGPAIKPYLY